MIPSFRLRKTRRGLLALALVIALAAAPAIAMAVISFNDVPTSNPFYNDIQAIAAAGVTGGCGGGNYCPDRDVTRAEMAAFMNRLGALQAGKTPVVNAAKLSGQPATAFHQYNTSAPALSTQYGAFSFQGNAAAAGNFGNANISFPVPINSDLTVHVIQDGAAVPSGCSGSATSPGASAGNLCIFVGWSSNISSTTVYNPATGLTGASHFGAQVLVASSTSGNFGMTGTWAATAPLVLIILNPSSRPPAGLAR